MSVLDLNFNKLVHGLVETNMKKSGGIGPLQFTITWYKKHLAGEQTAHWDIQNKRLLS